MVKKEKYIDKNFCIVPDWVIKKYKGKPICFVYGKIYSYSQMYLGACTASQGNIAEQLGISRKTVFSACQKLLSDGLIEDVTPPEKDRTGYTRYYSIKKSEDINTFDTTVTETEVTHDTSNVFTQVNQKTTQEVCKNYTPPVTNLHTTSVNLTHKYIDNINNNKNINIETDIKEKKEKFIELFGLPADWKDYYDATIEKYFLTDDKQKKKIAQEIDFQSSWMTNQTPETIYSIIAVQLNQMLQNLERNNP